MDKSDLRVVRTKQLLSTTLFRLLETTSFTKITVNDICKDALVSRSAFYAHFEDKYDLLQFSMKVLNCNILDEKKTGDFHEMIHQVLGNIKDNVRIFKNLLINDFEVTTLEMFRDSFQVELQEVISEKECFPLTLPEPVDVSIAYYAFGITSTIIYWIQKGLKYDIDTMANCINDLVLK